MKTIVKRVDLGVWKLVINPLTVVISHPGFIKIFVSPSNALKTPLFTADSKLLTTVVPTASILPPWF